MAAVVTQIAIEVLRSVSAYLGTPVSASTTINFSPTATGRDSVIRRVATSNIALAAATQGGGDCEAAASSFVHLSGNPNVHSTSTYASAVTAITFSHVGHPSTPFPITTLVPNLKFAGVASATLGQGPRYKFVSASTSFTLVGSSSTGSTRVYKVAATTNLNLPDLTTPLRYAHLLAGVSTGIQFSDFAAAVRLANAGANTTIGFQPSANGSRDIQTSAITSLGLSQGQGSNHFDFGSGAVAFSLDGLAVASHSGQPGESVFRFVTRADATVLLPAGGGIPGGTQAGLRTALLPSISGEFPNSYAETPNGLILIANGIDAMKRWNGLTGLADAAGVQPRSSPVELGGSGVGFITGMRAAYARFVDDQGNYSNLSVVSNYVDFGSDGIIGNVTYNPSTGLVTIHSEGHGLPTNAPVIIEGVQGIPIVNGMFTVNPVDDDRFTLYGVGVTGGTYTMGGRWVYGIATVIYGNVPIPTETKVVRRQILRNLDGNSETFYVDIDTTDLTGAAFSSTNSDEVLSAGDPVPLYTPDENPFANRFGVPPSHKTIVAAHLGRIFAAGEVAYTQGNAQPVFGYPTINGLGTAWRQSMAGRLMYLVGAKAAYEIAAVDEANQVITTTVNVTDTTGPFTSYAIRPAPAERRFIYFSEPALPEAWPAWNAVSLPEDSDSITGLMVKGSFLYVLEKRHIYKLTFEVEPTDARVWLTTRRGCLNDRCHVQVEDTAYMLDEIGLHQFDGQSSEPISEPIQNLFQQIGVGDLQVNWNADQRYWHAAHDPVRDTIRWFVAMTGSLFPRHAICYDYRRERFWIEEYPFVMTGSTIATIGYRRSLAGSDARRVLCLGEGSLDAIDAGNASRGTVTSAGPISITDSSAPFQLGLAGAPVSIASGKGCGQQRRITTNTTDTLKVDRPWINRPDSTSVYQIGGVNWTWQSGWFRYVDEESDNNRDVEMIFQPLKAGSSTNIRLFYDHADCPRQWSRTISQDGVGYIAGQPEVTVDMTYRTGYAAHRETGHRDPMAQGDRYVAVQLSGVQASEIHRVYQVTVNGARQV